MRQANNLVFGLVAAASIGLAGCDVEKTQEGNVTVPEYEVEKKQAGDVTLPKYDVTTPDVDVDKKKVEVTVPDIDVKTADEKKAAEEASGKASANQQ